MPVDALNPTSMFPVQPEPRVPIVSPCWPRLLGMRLCRAGLCRARDRRHLPLDIVELWLGTPHRPHSSAHLAQVMLSCSPCPSHLLHCSLLEV